MKKIIVVAIVVFSALVSFAFLGNGEEKKETEKVLLLRQAKQVDKVSAAVEAYLDKDILEVTVLVKMAGEKPRIDNVTVVGPGIGRLSCKMKKTLFATEEDEGKFFTDERAGFASKKSYKKLKGTTTKEFYKFAIPVSEIKPGKRYQIWVRFGSMQGVEGRLLQFKFDLKNLAHAILKEGEN